MWSVQTLAPGDPGKPGAPAGPTGPCRQNKNLQVRVHVCCLLCYQRQWHYNRKITWMNWIQSGNYDTHRWTSRTGQAIISTGTLKSKKTGESAVYSMMRRPWNYKLRIQSCHKQETERYWCSVDWSGCEFVTHCSSSSSRTSPLTRQTTWALRQKIQSLLNI